MGIRQCQGDFAQLDARAISKAENLAQMLLRMQDLKLSLHQLNLRRTIQISNLGVSATNFAIKSVRGNVLYEQLIAEGQRAAEAFLQDYGRSQSTTDDILTAISQPTTKPGHQNVSQPNNNPILSDEDSDGQASS